MILFICLILLLIVAIVFFAVFPYFKRKILAQKFGYYCDKKIRKISSKNNSLFLSKLNIINSEFNRINADAVIFGNKFVYILKNECLLGEVYGDYNDNSWFYKKTGEKTPNYIDNLNEVISKNIGDFAGIININPEFLVSICIVPNECYLDIKNAKQNNQCIVHYSSLASLIKKIESKNIAPLNKDEISQNFELLKDKNEER